MFLKEIYLKNYKCFEERTFSFGERFTVLVGDNGSGKTAVLDGIAKALAHLQAEFSGSDTDNLQNWNGNEIRVVPHRLGVKTNLEKQRDAKIKATASVEDNEIIDWHYGPGGGHLGKVNEYLNKTYLKVQQNTPVVLPMIAYYGTDRYWSSGKTGKIEPRKIASRLDTYKDCLKPNTNFKIIEEWFLRMELILVKRKTIPSEYQAVTDAVKKSLGVFQGGNSAPTQAIFSPEDDQLYIDIGNGKELPFSMLSGGQRNMIGMVADIAFRMAELNPHIATDSPGVVLIDEIDLHLHPKWQRTIISDLKRIFPNCQFIVTTHSPFIIQSLDYEDGIIRLDNEYEEMPENFTSQSIEDIVEEIQGVVNPQWSKKREKMYDSAKFFFKKLESMDAEKDEDEIQLLREELELIKKPFAANVAYTAFLEQKRLLKETSLKRGANVLNEPKADYKAKKK